AHVQKQRVGSGTEAPPAQVVRAVEPLVEPAEQVYSHERKGEPAVEPEPVGPPVDLQIERGLPRTRARVARGDLAELRGETTLDRRRGSREQRAHRAGDRSLRRRGRSEHEGPGA